MQELIAIKLLSIVVPSYNSQDYLRRCLDSVVQGGPEVEVIVVDDGSTDHTADIAREYCKLFPDIVRLEQKENGGHGSAVNRGLDVATGLFFKVVDSDDWLDIPSYRRALKALRANQSLDLLIANYVYEYFYNGKRNIVRFRNIFPQDEVIGWNRMQRFRLSQLMLMHSLIYRTQLLRDCGLRLPEHTFYVDNLVAYLPLPYVKKLMYIDCNLYRYFIGRPDQSVNTSVMIRRIDQQLLVTKLMIGAYDLFNEIPYKNLRRYMLHYLAMMIAISIIHINISDDSTLQPKAADLWEFTRQKDEKLYLVLRRSFLNMCIDLANKTSRHVTRQGFRLAKRIYKFS
jgi:glycosyltransferase involved in cell wall biosynthesis